MKARLCLIVAADIEYKAATDVLHKHPDSDGIILLKAGIGALKFGKHELQSRGLERVIIAGICGALDAGLRKGDVIVYEQIRSVKGTISLDASLTNQLSDLLACRRGVGVTVEKVVSRASEKAALLKKHDAIAVDMETYPLAALCTQLGIPVAVMRVVSDEAHEDLPDFNRSLNEHGEIVAWKLPHTMLARPRASLRMISSFKTTIVALKGALEIVLSGLKRG
jgi:nucleoside phosphorylase